MARKRSQDIDQIESKLHDIESSLTRSYQLFEHSLSISETALNNSHQSFSKMASIIRNMLYVIALLSAAGLAVGLWSKVGLPSDVSSEVSAQVPPVVNANAMTQVPVVVGTAVSQAISIQLPLALEGVESSIVETIVPIALESVKDELANAAVVAVNEALGNFTVIISSYIDLDGAKFEVERAKQLGYDPVIYFFDNYYNTTIGNYATEEQLRIALDQIRSEVRSNAYFLDLGVSCPYPKFQNAGFYACKLVPWE